MQLLRKLLFPFSLIYALVVYLRNFLFDISVLSSQEFDVPIVCIGNLSVGGTGKTPMTEFLIELLKPHYNIAVLSRGYKRKSSGFLMADENTSVEELGDEPYQIHHKFPEVTVAVDADRREGIQILTTKLQPELILLDDAYQHRKVKPDVCILLTSYGNLYVDDWYLPTGNLRDCKSAAHRAELIIVTKCPPTLNPEGQNKIINKLRPKAHQIVLFSFLEYESSVYGQEKKLELDILLEKNITLVTGIANATPFVNHLKSIGLSFEHKEFKDHHFFTDKEIDTLRTKELILTTEKDFVRLRHHLSNLYYLPIRHRFMNKGKEVIFQRLNELMKERS